MDQASFLGLRALGYGALVQFSWIYNRPVNVDGLRRFHRYLGYGLLGRRVERSPLPFARDRWVFSRGPEDLEIAETPRPRADLNAWTYERACLPLDPEYGPSWHLGVLPLEDGGTAISLVTSHTLVDGLGILQAITDAANGRIRYLAYPRPGSRTRGRALLQDGRQTFASAPELARALAATVRLARDRRKDVASSIASAPPSPRLAGDDQPVVVPSLTAYVDLVEWDARAKSIGGNSNTLLAGFAARLGVRMGRICDDGTVTVSLPISDRSENDTRGNALAFPVVSVDPTHLSSDLGGIRVKVKQAIADLAETSEELLAPLALTSMTPRWVARRAAGVGLGAAALPIGCSNVGDLDPAVNRPDGSDADYASGRLIEPGINKRTLERVGGQLFVVSGRGPGKIWFCINAYLAGRTNSQDALREVTSRTFAEFDLAA
ncbi:MAG: fatty acyl-AMP ligase, partial [Mycobacterium sp.]